MRDVTREMQRFRESVRHNWNTYFLDLDDRMSSDIQEAYSSVERGLFKAIIGLDSGGDISEYRKRPISWLLVKPTDILTEVSIQLAEDGGSGNVSWTLPLSVSCEGAIFEFFDFFDWYSYGPIDLALVRARVKALPGRPESEGLFALLEQKDCRFELLI